MRQFRRTWANQDRDHGDFHLGVFPRYLVSHRPHCSHAPHEPHESPCQPGPQDNQPDSTLNAGGTEFGRIGPVHCADGVSQTPVVPTVQDRTMTPRSVVGCQIGLVVRLFMPRGLMVRRR